MIETSIKNVDGVIFISDIRIVPPYEKENGIHVERVYSRESREAEIQKGLKALGLRKVGLDYYRDTDIYTSYPVNFIIYKIIHAVMRFYWVSLWWLYGNARMFKQIPEGEMFSWRYFTPYCQYVSIKKRLSVKYERT